MYNLYYANRITVHRLDGDENDVYARVQSAFHPINLQTIVLFIINDISNN